jgi:hypothetical protein
MPLDKDVFVVALGRRDDFNSFPKQNRGVYCKTRTEAEIDMKSVKVCSSN